MNSLNSFQIVTLACFIAAGIFFIISVILFFLLDMVKVINDLTGHTAKKEIENIRSQNQRTGTKVYKSSKVNAERGKLTDKISSSGSIIKNDSSSFGGSMGTEKIDGSNYQNTGYEDTTMLEQGTSVLNENIEETSILDNGMQETSVLSYGDNINETSVLSNDVMAPPYAYGGSEANETSLLSENGINETSVLNAADVFRINVSVDQEIRYIFTDEIVV